MLTEAEIRKMVDEVIRRDEKTGEHVNGLGHLSYVGYKIDEIYKPRRVQTDKGERCQINYVYTVNVETEFLPHPDRLYGHTYRKMLLLDESGNIIAESKKEEIQKERENKKSVEELLGEAEELLHRDIDKELDIMKRNRWSFYLVNEEKYTEAKKLFEQVLASDHANEKARKGLAICEYMLTPYHATQYMMPPEWIDRPREEPDTPWELLGKYKEDDERGMRYTGEMYSKDEEEAQKEAQRMIEEAKKKVEDGASPMAVYKETEEKLRDMQEKLHHGWKGHGPEILESSLKALKDACGAVEP